MRPLTAPSDATGASEEEVDGLAADIRDRYRSLLLELTIEAVETGLVLCGRAVTYYGKQMAQHEVIRRGHVVAANRIRVLEPAERKSR